MQPSTPASQAVRAARAVIVKLFVDFYVFTFTSFSERVCMALAFPNSSRSYDATRRAVRFWGHDSAMEWSFFVTAEALQRVHPAMVPDEAGMLGAFDSHRELICIAATKLYSRGRKGSYELGAGDIN